MSTNPLLLLQNEGVSVWLDYLSRDLMNEGGLQKLIDEDGLRGETSNPAIFQKAISHGESYSEPIHALAKQGLDAEAICWELMIGDVQRACDMFRPLYEASEGRHGYVSLECNPHLADETEAELAQARELWTRVGRPNLLVKVPGTKAGLPVIEACLYEGINVNVTLLFAVQRYEEVMEVYLRALERRAAEGKPIDRIASVASFFVSRVDTEAEKRLAKIADPAVPSVLGKIAVANAQVAYEAYERCFGSSPRWQALAAKGARVQNPLWASTSVKNPAYPDTLYVAELIGPDCVNTMPEETVDAFRDHGVCARTLNAANAAAAHAVLATLKRLGVDLDDITLNTLEREGVQKFNDAYDQLLKAVSGAREKELSRA